MTIDVLRLTVGTLAVFVAGSSLVTAVRYFRASIRLGRSPGRILARHVGEVALGVTGLSVGYASAIGDQLGAEVSIPADARLWIYLVSMVLLLIGLVEIGTYQRARARAHPARQAQVRHAIRAAIDRHRVTGPRSADIAAVKAANAVLELEGTPTMPVPDAPRREAPQDPDPVSATDYGRHAVRRNRRPSP